MDCVIICTSKREDVYYIDPEVDAEALAQIVVDRIEKSVDDGVSLVVHVEGVGKKGMYFTDEITSVTYVDLDVQARLDAQAEDLFDENRMSPGRTQ